MHSQQVGVDLRAFSSESHFTDFLIELVSTCHNKLTEKAISHVGFEKADVFTLDKHPAKVHLRWFELSDLRHLHLEDFYGASRNWITTTRFGLR